MLLKNKFDLIWVELLLRSNSNKILQVSQWSDWFTDWLNNERPNCLLVFKDKSALAGIFAKYPRTQLF